MAGGRCAVCRSREGYVEATGAVKLLLELAGRAFVGQEVELNN